MTTPKTIALAVIRAVVVVTDGWVALRARGADEVGPQVVVEKVVRSGRTTPGAEEPSGEPRQLLRMGPDTVRVLRSKLAELRAALTATVSTP